MIAFVNGAELYYEVHGAGEPTVVFIHDRAGTHHVWHRQAEALARRCRAVTFDSRGVGRSTLGECEYTIELLADDVAGLLDHLGAERACLVGISMGGGVAQVCALRHPRRVSSLILVSTSSEFAPATRTRMRGEAAKIDKHGVDAPMLDAMTSRWFSPSFARDNPHVVDDVRSTILRMDSHVLALRSRANAERDFTSRLSEITCPVLYVGGEADPMDPAGHAQRYRGKLADLTVRLVPDASHHVPIEAAEEFSALLADFILSPHRGDQWPGPRTDLSRRPAPRLR